MMALSDGMHAIWLFKFLRWALFCSASWLLRVRIVSSSTYFFISYPLVQRWPRAWKRSTMNLVFLNLAGSLLSAKRWRWQASSYMIFLGISLNFVMRISNAVRGDSGAPISVKPRQNPWLQNMVKTPSDNVLCLLGSFLQLVSLWLIESAAYLAFPRHGSCAGKQSNGSCSFVAGVP